jgi:NitT/TauT family transport system substrate-binding protein
MASPATPPHVPVRKARSPVGRTVVALAIASAATACGSSAGATSPGGPEKPSITVAALPIVANAPAFIAEQEGLFRQQGLDVTIKPVAQSTAAIADLLHGSVDVITGANYVSFFKAEDSGILSLKILADEATCAPNANEIVVLQHSGITKPADLAGKTVAVNILNDIQTMTTNEVLRADDVSTAHVHYVVIPFPDMATALAAHRIDAAYEVEPFLSEAEDKIGAESVVDACYGPTVNIPIGGAVTTAAWTRQYPKTARAFQRAMEKAAALADTNRALVEQVVTRDIHVSKQIAAIINVGQFPTTVDPVQLQRTADQMSESGLLKKPIHVNALIFH